MSIKQQIIESGNQDIERIKNALEGLDWIPELEGGEGILCHGGGYRIAFPFDRNLLEKNHKEMLNLGFEVHSEITEQEAADNWWSPSTTYQKDGRFIQLIYFEWRPGSVCKRNLVGKVTKEVNVYEYSCAEIGG